MSEHPEEWRTTSLGEVADWLSGGTPSKANPAFWVGDIPWISPKDMKTFHIGEAQDWVSREAVAAGSRLAPKDAILLVVRGMILAHTFPVCLTTREVSFNQDVKAVIAREGVDSGFLAQWFRGRAHQMLGLVTEATHGTKRIELSDLHAYEFALPPLPEQRAIAHVLTKLDALIADAEAAIAKLEAIRQGLMHALLTRGLDENGELRDPVRHPEQFQDSPLGRIPRGWEIQSLRWLLVSPPRNGLYKPPHMIGNGSLMVGQLSFTADNRVDFSASRRAELATSELEQFRLSSGDILVVRVFATVGGIGRAIYVDAPPEPAVYESNMMRLRVDHSKMDSVLLWHWLRMPWARQHIVGQANVSTQASINQQGLGSVRCVVPDRREQEQICARLCGAEALIQVESTSLVRLQQMKSGLTDDLLTGRRRVPLDLIT